MILLQNLIRLANTNVNKNQPDQILNRKIQENSPLTTNVQRGDDLFQIRCNSDFTLFSKRKLEPVANESVVKSSTDFMFIDMYPIFPTIDLKDEYIYKHDLHTIGLRTDNCPVENVHTFFHIYDDKLSDQINTSRLIMFAFGHAYAKTKLLQQKGVFFLLLYN